MKLGKFASFVKSNNAGAAYLTFDVGFKDKASFDAAVAAKVISAVDIARLYPYAGDDIRIFVFPPARVIKITIPRPTPSGGAEERDFDGVQQFAPLLDLDVAL
jgi:hypothetical protein